uniref:Transmembrane protein 182 n=1 Tax=Pavo cristatus TaxID=9049 RepID=A0A8C9EXP5_PAVCR
MKAGVAALTAGILGSTAVLLFLLAFGTDYWLLAADTCGVIGDRNSTHQHGEVNPQPAHPKHCMHGYLFPMPIVLGPFPHPSYDTTAVYRGFWTAFIILAVAAGLVGGLLLVCGVPFVSARSHKVGGGFLIASGNAHEDLSMGGRTV